MHVWVFPTFLPLWTWLLVNWYLLLFRYDQCIVSSSKPFRIYASSCPLALVLHQPTKEIMGETPYRKAELIKPNPTWAKNKIEFALHSHRKFKTKRKNSSWWFIASLLAWIWLHYMNNKRWNTWGPSSVWISLYEPLLSVVPRFLWAEIFVLPRCAWAQKGRRGGLTKGRFVQPLAPSAQRETAE